VVRSGKILIVAVRAVKGCLAALLGVVEVPSEAVVAEAAVPWEVEVVQAAAAVVGASWSDVS